MSRAEDLIDLYARLLAENRLLRECVRAVDLEREGRMPRWQLAAICRKAAEAIGPAGEGQ